MEDLKTIASLVAEELRLSQKEFLTTAEAAKYLGVSVHHLHRLTSEKQISYYKPGGRLCYFDRAELDAWVRKNRIASNSEISARAQARAGMNY